MLDIIDPITGVTVLKHKIGLALAIIIQLILLTAQKSVVADPKSPPAQTGKQMAFERGSRAIGSAAYIRHIKLHAEKYGNKSALSKIIGDVDGDAGQISRNTYADNLRLYRMVSYIAGKIGYVEVKTHYLRNRLNQSPKTLKDLMLQNDRLPKNRQWRLVPVKGSLYHMQGPDGIYNLKFVSPDGFCEAVYNRLGNLLTENNDPVNMGTFNYSEGIHQRDAHAKYDITPYLKWGNSPNSPQKGYSAIHAGVKAAAESYNRNTSAVTIYRKKYETKKGVAYASSPFTPYISNFLPGSITKAVFHYLSNPQPYPQARGMTVLRLHEPFQDKTYRSWTGRYRLPLYREDAFQ